MKLFRALLVLLVVGCALVMPPSSGGGTVCLCSNTSLKITQKVDYHETGNIIFSIPVGSVVVISFLIFFSNSEVKLTPIVLDAIVHENHTTIPRQVNYSIYSFTEFEGDTWNVSESPILSVINAKHLQTFAFTLESQGKYFLLIANMDPSQGEIGAGISLDYNDDLYLLLMVAPFWVGFGVITVFFITAGMLIFRQKSKIFLRIRSHINY